MDWVGGPFPAFGLVFSLLSGGVAAPLGVLKAALTSGQPLPSRLPCWLLARRFLNSHSELGLA